ncbi:MAG TPA: glycosyltransferase [Kiritimatiellia bacterium]|nr:glycosyltransferase [Kiritimatiellia bacterium]
MIERPFLSLVIPAHNEEGSIGETCEALLAAFAGAGVEDFEIVVVNDHSTDGTAKVVERLMEKEARIRLEVNPGRAGFGHAVRWGLGTFRGEAVAVVMGDLSDSPEDVLKYYQELKNGAECVFGSRFMKGGRVIDYPRHKLVLNRLANTFIRLLFRVDHNDITNAFKGYRREVIQGIQPLLSSHFNLTVEMPLKAVVRGYQVVKLPISWTNRKAGVSKLKIKEMGSRYLFIVLYCWLEKKLSRGDYYRDRP